MDLKIRKASPDDCMKIIELSNDPEVRKNAVNHDEIVLAEHIEWFNKRLFSADSDFYVVNRDHNEFIGQIRFDKRDAKVYVTVSLVKEYRGKSLGKVIIMKATELTSYNIIHSVIRKNNVASLKSFQNSGYELESEDDEFYILKIVK